MSERTEMPAETVTGFEPLARGLYLEGLAVDSARGAVWYSDVIAGGVHGLWPDGRTEMLNPGRMWTGGVLMNADGCVLSSGPGGVMWNEPGTDRSGWLIREIAGRPISGVNEMVPDLAGGLYFGVIDLDAVIRGATPGPSAIFRLSANGDVTLVAEGLTFVNGLALSADGTRLFCNDSFAATYAFEVAPDGGLSQRRLLLDKPDADGLALDAAGNLWITGFRSSELSRVTPGGELLGAVATPGGAVTQVRFGGADLRDVYVNTVPADGGDGLAAGALPTEPRSVLYRGRSATPGSAAAPARFQLN